ncbi:MAG: ribulose-phosphate 3-epimerase [Pseudomonadota bacterium]|jgi:ribulose-phosphate 3-epimerase|nr:ribulose-phosphate 3-epimerase [Alphaproteobacteria bacterium]
MKDNKKSVLIAPSLMAANMLSLKDEVKAVEIAGADWLHLDIMDGHFVPNLTFGPDIIKQLRAVSSLPFDVHLMVEPVELCIDLYQKAGADHITIHAEATSDLKKNLENIRNLGCKAGVSLKPETPVDRIIETLNIIDLVLVMSVNPGFYGQAFIPSTLEKISQLKKLREEKKLDFLIVVDGGINVQNSSAIIKAGADVMVAGNSVFKQQNYQQAIYDLRN